MRPKKTTNNQSVRVISRAADILRALKHDGRGLSLGQIAERIDLPRSTVQRLVNGLMAERLVMASSSGGGLRLGPEVQQLAAASRIEVADLVRPVLADISESTGETVDLAAFREDHMVFVDQVVGKQRLRAVSAIGDTFPMTTTANGKAALSTLDDALVSALVEHEIEAGNVNLGRKSALQSEITAARENGYALDLDEHTLGISAVGVAFETPAALTYAVSIPVPSQRFEQKRQALVSSLLEAAEKMRAML